VIYANKGVFYDRARWFRIVRHESDSDTQLVPPWDRYLAQRSSK
jgi:hypothetical protein